MDGLIDRVHHFGIESLGDLLKGRDQRDRFSLKAVFHTVCQFLRKCDPRGSGVTIVLRNQLVQHVCILPLRCSHCPLVLKMLLLIIMSVNR